MKFGLRPPKPQPPLRMRRRIRRTLGTSTYGVLSDSEESSEDEYQSEDDVESEVAKSDSSDSEDSFCYASDSEIPQRRSLRSTQEDLSVTEAMQAVRLHAQYNDPLEEWQRQTKQEAFELAHNRMRESKSSLVALYMTAAQLTEEKLAKTREQQLKEVEAIMEKQRKIDEQRALEEQQMWEKRTRELWTRIDKATAIVESRLEAQRKAAEEEARRVKEEKERLKSEQERKAKAEIERKEREEEAKKKTAEKKRLAEEEERKRLEAEEKERKEVELKRQKQKAELSRFEKERKELGITTAQEDWETALDIVNDVKHGHLKRVKEDPVQRREWTRIRRAVTLRIGQITNDAQEVARISTQIFQTISAINTQSDLYAAALSALAKAIILQAETEVTAKPDTAGQLAAVTINLFILPGFNQVLWAKMVLRSGGWLVGKLAEREPGQDEKLFRKLAGIKEDETQLERHMRIGGVVMTFFAISVSKTSSVLPEEFRPTKMWLFFARILGDPRLLKQTMAPYIMHACLEVAAGLASEMYGKQWIKMLYAIGHASVQENRMGGADDAGKTARVRLQLRAEALLKKLSAL